MSVLFVVVPLAMLIVGAAVWAFVWGVKHGQFDDLETPATRVALEDDDYAAQHAPDTAERTRS